jgi:hypothetical protein
MHNAPSVSYPVGRCAFQRWLFGSFAALASALLVVWAFNQGLTWLWYGAACVMVLGVGLGWQTLGQRGVLTWDGQAWCLHDQTTGHEDALSEPQVIWDVQKALLLRWQPASDTLHSQPQWLWLCVQDSDNHWQDLRRAVYQRNDQ